MLLAPLAPSAAKANGDMPGVVSVTVERPYDEVRQDLEDAIVNRGYVVDYNAHIGDMLSRTAEDVGAGRAIYTKAEAMQFCSAVLSRKAMEADPMNIAYCPYVLFVYERADTPGSVTVGHRKLGEGTSAASAEALGDIDGVLTEIVEEAAGE
ncbi:DUF302 domain-containing protein [Breoghania sp. L-A4]|nr:DUF302 domain-containing protein [Breoghania sp. L-A4]